MKNTKILSSVIHVKKLLLVGVFFCTCFKIQAQQLQINNKLEFKLFGQDSSITLENLRSYQGAVVIFLDKSCPFSSKYITRLQKIILEHPRSAFVIVGDLMELKSGGNLYHCKKNVLVKTAFKVTKSPEVFLVSTSQLGNVVYHGAIDDNAHFGGDVKNQWLNNAIKAYTTSQPISIEYKRPVGCMIK